MTTNQSKLTSAEEPVSFILNGDPVSIAVPGDCSLLEVLRDRFGITSPKNGCAPEGQCGCCTVLVDGKARLSCVLKAAKVAGKRVTTLEGIDSEVRDDLADCFVRAGACQCGFCTPGIALRTVGLIQRYPKPTRAQILHALRDHLCRCSGYLKIFQAIELFAARQRGELAGATDVPELDTSGKVGTRLGRYRGREFVLGEFRYIDDMQLEDCLYAALRFSDHPRALLKGVDATAALKQPGVVRVLTAEDIPGERYVGLLEQDWPVLVAPGEETRCVGDVIAIVVAEDRAQARAAAALLEVDYEVREPVTSPQDALKPDAPKIHPGGNLLSRAAVCYGDVEAAFAASAYVVEGDYETQRIEHMFLEPEACIAVPLPGTKGVKPRLKVYTQGQGVFEDRRQIASMLGWEPERVEVELVSNGGAFGGKEDLSIQGQTALAAVLCGRPVKCTLTRPESLRLHPKRHPVKMQVRLGCDAEGRITAFRSRIIGDKGAYASVGAKVLERAAGHAAGPYRVPNLDVESLAVYTNNPPCGAMRGFGVNQSAFAVESLLNRLARKVGIDAWEIRWRNALQQGDRFCTGQKLDKPFGFKQTLEAVRDIFRGAKYAGIACGVKNVGLGNGAPDYGKAVLTVEPDGEHVTIRTGFTEMGQGSVHHLHPDCLRRDRPCRRRPFTPLPTLRSASIAARRRQVAGRCWRGSRCRRLPKSCGRSWMPGGS